MTRLRTRLSGMALACAGLVSAPPAKADPGTFAVVLSSFLAVETAVAVTVALYTYGAYVLTGYAIYGSIAARNKAKRQAAAARAAYNAGLQDRNITALTASPGRRVIYGRCDTGGDLVAIFTSDKYGASRAFFGQLPVTKPDAYKHLIIVWASHQCAAIHGLKVDGIPVGALDAAGWAIADEWKKSDPKPNGYGQQAGNVLTRTLPAGSTITSVTLISGGDGLTHTPIAPGAGGYSFSGTTLTLPSSVTVGGFPYAPTAADSWDIAYSSDDVSGTSSIRVRHHLGAPDQAADAELIALLPDKWTADHRLRGRCYSWITLDLERAQFQGGPPGITADISGALVLDPRTGNTQWSQNPALCAYDYLRRVEGMGVTAAEVDTASVIASANECDVATSFTVGGVTTTAPRYTCNGAFVAGAAKEAVLIDICEAMAGFHTYSGQWRILAGSWTPPVMDLTDADLHGSISIVQAGEPSGELFNSVRGQYVPAGSSVPADIETYSNATFVAADGRALYTDIELPFTNSRARAKNISRIKVEQSRAGEVIFFPAKLRAWPLQTGDRVRVTSAEYGFAAKVFRVTDWQFGLRSPVGLTLQEDGPDIYDEADAATADPQPNTDLPNPWFVEPLGVPTAASGTAQLQRLGDGTVISRVLVSWPRSTAAYMQGGRIEVAWREAGSNTIQLAYADGLDTELYLTGVRDGAFIAIQVIAINTQGVRSAPRAVGHKVVGKSAAPGAVQGLAAAVVPGAVRVTRTPSTELDYDYTIYRYGASFTSGTQVPGTSDERGILWAWPALGAYTIWAADVDTSGNVGAPVSTSVTVDSSVITGVQLVNDAGMTITGNTVVKTGGSGGSWDASVRSKDGYTGGAFVSWVVTSIAHSHGLGLNSDPTANASYDTIDAWLYVEAGTQNLYAFNNGTAQNLGNPIGSYNVGDVLAVTYDGSVFRYYRNGAVQFSQAATVTGPLFLDSSFNTAGTKVTNIQFGPLTSNSWASIGGRPKSYLIRSVGYRAVLDGTSPYAAGLYDAESGLGLQGIGSMYQVMTINRSTLALTNLGTFNTLAGGGNPAAMAAALNGIPTGSHIVIVATYDEPQGNRLTGGLLAAMLRHGASRSVFGSSEFKFRAAYILVGISGCGEGNGAEVYAGAVDDDANAFCELAFSLFNGSLTVSGTTSGARSLVDYGYTGDLAATRNQTYYQDTDPTVSPGGVVDGAIWVTSTKSWQRYGGVWRPYVGTGSVDTGELAANAATTLAEAFFTSVDVTGTSNVSARDSYSASFNLLGTVTFTPKVTGVANLYISATLTAAETYTRSAAGTAQHFVNINVDQDDDGVAEAGDEVAKVALQQYVAAGFALNWSGPVAGRVQIATVAGVSRTLRVYGQQLGTAAATYTLGNLRLGVEGINR